MPKILIVEDDKKLKNEIAVFLNNNGFKACFIDIFEDVENEILKINPDLVLLDISLPNADGQYILKNLRKKSNVPVIIITSRANELDELVSINYGADHYVTKPFNIQILLAKINTLLKRSSSQNLQDKINAKDFIVNISCSKVIKEGKEIELTKNELRILKFLCENRNKIVSREEIMNYLWDSENFIDDNTLTVNIARLRNKLEELNLKELLETKRGQGYILKYGGEDEVY